MSIRIIDNDATCLRIKEMLDEKGLTPKEVQRALQLESVQAVYKWVSLNNKTIPSLDNLVQLTKLLDCKLEDILVLNDIVR